MGQGLCILNKHLKYGLFGTTVWEALQRPGEREDIVEYLKAKKM